MNVSRCCKLSPRSQACRLQLSQSDNRLRKGGFSQVTQRTPSVCYPRPFLASGARGDLEGTLKEFLFYKFLTQRFLFEEKQQKRSKDHSE